MTNPNIAHRTTKQQVAQYPVLDQDLFFDELGETSGRKTPDMYIHNIMVELKKELGLDVFGLPEEEEMETVEFLTDRIQRPSSFSTTVMALFGEDTFKLAAAP